MMGNDCERMLSYLTQMKDNCQDCIIGLSNATAYQITTEGVHGEAEVPVPSPASLYTQPFLSIWNAFQKDYSKMSKLESGMYTSSSNFHNSYGSPWKELHKLKDIIQAVTNYIGIHGSLSWVGEKAGLLGLLNAVLSRTIDAEHALLLYNDYVQRGFDHVYNGNKASITHKVSKKKKSIGNIRQKYEENVNVEEDPIEPF